MIMKMMIAWRCSPARRWPIDGLRHHPPPKGRQLSKAMITARTGVRNWFRDDARCRGRACSTLPVVGSNFCILAKWVERARPTVVLIVLIPKTLKHPVVGWRARKRDWRNGKRNGYAAR